jgi:Ca2+/H+ antiporter
VIAHRIGEPYGTLLLTLSVTIIEVSLIATILLGEQEVPTLARDSVFAVVMIIGNGLVLCIFIGPHYREQHVQVSGANLYLSVLFTMATIALILPNYTLTKPGVYSEALLEFVSVVTILLYSAPISGDGLRRAVKCPFRKARSRQSEESQLPRASAINWRYNSPGLFVEQTSR